MKLQDYHIHTNYSPDCKMMPEEAVEAAIKMGLSEICFTDHMDLGHIGYISKCRHYEENSLTYEMFPELIDEILTTIISNGKGIEVNTSGIDKVGHELPHPSIVQRYKELGGSIIKVGSDAHTPERVRKYIKEIICMI